MVSMSCVALCALFSMIFAYPYPQSIKLGDLDISTANLNQYTTYHCTDAQKSALSSLFADINHDIPFVLTEATLGIASTYGFSPLFKTSANITPVTSLFGHIAAQDRLNTSTLRYSISFVCVNPGDSFTSKKLHFAYSNPDVPAISDSNTNEIFIFPLFWEGQRSPASTLCPRIKGNKAVPNDGSLVSNQYCTIIHELADKYLYFGKSREQLISDAGEVYNVQDAIELSGGKSLNNAQNYALFACGECFLRYVLGESG